MGHKKHNIDFIAVQVVYKGLKCIEEGPVHHFVCIYYKPISNSHVLLKINRN